MNVKLSWRVFLNTKDEKKAKKLVERLFEALGNNCELLELEIYWKNVNWHELSFRQCLKQEIPSEILIEILNKLSLVSYHWNLDLTPNFIAEDCTDLSGDTNHGIRVPGIISLVFQVIP
jgi:hypothetical protein